MAGWTDFATVAGGATAALLGLLFVAVSIRVDTIARSAELRNRSAETMSLLLIGLLASLFVAVPGQQTWALGAELVALAVVASGVAVVLDRRAGDTSGSALARAVDATNPTSVTCVLLLVSGIVLILGHPDGLYVLVPALIAVLVGCVVNAWLILVRVGG